MPHDSGSGPRLLKRFYFDSKERKCETFFYKGLLRFRLRIKIGNDRNNFEIPALLLGNEEIESGIIQNKDKRTVL